MKNTLKSQWPKRNEEEIGGVHTIISFEPEVLMTLMSNCGRGHPMFPFLVPAFFTTEWPLEKARYEHSQPTSTMPNSWDQIATRTYECCYHWWRFRKPNSFDHRNKTTTESNWSRLAAMASYTLLFEHSCPPQHLVDKPPFAWGQRRILKSPLCLFSCSDETFFG